MELIRESIVGILLKIASDSKESKFRLNITILIVEEYILGDVELGRVATKALCNEAGQQNPHKWFCSSPSNFYEQSELLVTRLFNLILIFSENIKLKKNSHECRCASLNYRLIILLQQKIVMK